MSMRLLILCSFGTLLKSLFVSGLTNSAVPFFNTTENTTDYDTTGIYVRFEYNTDSFTLFYHNTTKEKVYIEPVFFRKFRDSLYYSINYSNLTQKEIYPTLSNVILPRDSIVLKGRVGRTCQNYCEKGDTVVVVSYHSKEEKFYTRINYTPLKQVYYINPQ